MEIAGERVDDLKLVLAAPDDAPLVPSDILDLAGWMSVYYAVPLGSCLRAIIPSALWGESRLVATLVHPSAAPGGTSQDVVSALKRAGGELLATALARQLQRPVWDALQRLVRAGAVRVETRPADTGPAPGSREVLVLLDALPSLTERDRVFGRAWKQRAAFETVDSLGGEATVSTLRTTHGYSRSVLNALAERGVAKFETRKRLRDPFSSVAGTPPHEPSQEQTSAIGAIKTTSTSSVVTLFGVTGSGKTLVYLEAIREQVESGRGAIILVPEISLTPQTIARVRGVFGDRVAVLHSALSDGERADAWRALAAGTKTVAVGARSAVFAPVRELAAIIIDEEHDSSYKNGETPRYHARDVALKRAATQSAKVVLSSATPSLETWSRRDRGVVVRLPQRVAAQELPRVEMVDMRSEPKVRESGPIPWSMKLDRAVESKLQAGEQVILLLNRRGFAHYLQCTACGNVAGCPQCSISLTVHRIPRRLSCHYCGFSDTVPDVCAVCGSRTQRSQGVGTQQLDRWLSEWYPGARTARMDADTTGGKWSHQRILEAFEGHEVDVLFGTQMIAKGLDFPGVTLVGVIDADTGLHLPDFRAAERTFQLISQVAGRSGRSQRGGEVLVQTRRPEHYALVAAAHHDFEGFAERELELRREPPYPPHVWLVNVVISGSGETVVAEAAVELGRWMRAMVAAKGAGGVDVVGPSPAPISRIKGRWRWHVLLRSSNRSLLGKVIRYSVRNVPKHLTQNLRVVYDRDPVSLF